MKVLQHLLIDGGRSKEQGNFYDQSKIAQASIPLRGTPPKPNNKVSVFRNGVFDVIPLVLKGNKRMEVGKTKFKVFPTSASEASNPQIVRRVKK